MEKYLSILANMIKTTLNTDFKNVVPQIEVTGLLSH